MVAVVLRVDATMALTPLKDLLSSNEYTLYIGSTLSYRSTRSIG